MRDTNEETLWMGSRKSCQRLQATVPLTDRTSQYLTEMPWQPRPSFLRCSAPSPKLTDEVLHFSTTFKDQNLFFHDTVSLVNKTNDLSLIFTKAFPVGFSAIGLKFKPPQRPSLVR